MYLDEILSFNKEFVQRKNYERYITDKLPNKKIAVITCMDSRLISLLPKSMGFDIGDINIIRNSGGIVDGDFGIVMKSILIAIYRLGVQEIFVIGHNDCGIEGLNSESFINDIKLKVSEEKINSCNIDLLRWLNGVDKVEKIVIESVNIIKKHPLIYNGMSINGLMINSKTGELKKIQ